MFQLILEIMAEKVIAGHPAKMAVTMLAGYAPGSMDKIIHRGRRSSQGQLSRQPHFLVDVLSAAKFVQACWLVCVGVDESDFEVFADSLYDFVHR